jgi:aspartate racemase
LRKLGIVGGTSWASTTLYYDHINRGVAQRLGGLHSARLVIESLDLAPIAELELSGDWDAVAKHEIEAAARLQAAGAEGIVIASNTGHKCYDAVAANVDVPVLHIGDATADRLVADGRTRVALLGTRFTMTEPYVRSRLEARKITLVPIESGWMNEIDRIIFEELAMGRVVRDSQRKLKTLITELGKQKVQAVVLGCTELPLLIKNEDYAVPILNTLDLHCEKAVDFSLGA